MGLHDEICSLLPQRIQFIQLNEWDGNNAVSSNHGNMSLVHLCWINPNGNEGTAANRRFC